MRPDEPTDEMPGGPEDPTEALSSEEHPTRRIPAADESPTEPLAAGDENPTERIPAADPGDKRGILVLCASILAAVLLVGAYAVAGGPVGPDKAVDPCDPRPWTDPGNAEEAAQQFALSAADGAACELGVTREELARSIPEESTRQQFMEDHGFSDSDLENALRAGLNRAVDDAENAGALGGLVATGIRAAIRVMPMSVMIGLLENASSVFEGGMGSLGGIGDAIDSITEGLGELNSGSSDDPLEGLGNAIEQAIPEGTTGDLNDLVPEETRGQLEDKARERLRQGIEDLLGP